MSMMTYEELRKYLNDGAEARRSGDYSNSYDFDTSLIWFKYLITKFMVLPEDWRAYEFGEGKEAWKKWRGWHSNNRNRPAEPSLNISLGGPLSSLVTVDNLACVGVGGGDHHTPCPGNGPGHGVLPGETPRCPSCEAKQERWNTKMLGSQEGFSDLMSWGSSGGSVRLIEEKRMAPQNVSRPRNKR